MCVLFLRVTVAAKYALCRNNRDTLNSYNYVVVLYVNMLNHITASQRAKWELSTNNEENELPVRAV